jgi:NCS1 family nucleobase:cation symporter-1
VMVGLFAEVGSKLGHSTYHPTFNTSGMFLLMVSIVVSWQVTYAPLVSEFSRYLPETTKTGRTVLYTFIGSAGGAILFMALGAMAGTIAFNDLNDNTSKYLGGLLPIPIGLALLVIFLALVAAVCENIYGVYTTTMATISPDGTKVSPRITRPLITGIVAVAGGFIEAAISAHFLTDLTNFLSFILYLLIPWTAINLVDYYLVRRGHYDVGQILDRSGKYGLVIWPAIFIYLVATAVQIPFMDTSIYEGPVASHLLGGGDIAWIVGLATASGLYYAGCRLGLVPAGREAWPRQASPHAPVSPAAATAGAGLSKAAD